MLLSPYRNTAMADPANIRPPSVVGGTSLETDPASRFTADTLLHGTGVEPATARVSVWCSNQAELTAIDGILLETMIGTHPAEPCRVASVPLDGRHQRSGIKTRLEAAEFAIVVRVGRIAKSVYEKGAETLAF
jgi:hypothetical protein